jgi:catechol 2,3-dioxygenase-like lactoylglutathione lyase family enzyme
MTGPASTLIVLRCADLTRSRQFYEAIGLSFVEEQHGRGPVHYAATLDSGLVLELYPATRTGQPEGGAVGDVRLGFSVDSATAVVAELQRHGFDVPSPGSAPTIVVADPDGRRIELS